MNPARELETIYFQKFATPESNFAEVGFGAKIGHQKLHDSSQFQALSVAIHVSTLDFGLNPLPQIASAKPPPTVADASGCCHPPRVIRAKKEPSTLLGKVLGMNLATSYFHRTCRPTIIGAEAFHFRVRNGTGWFHLALVTRGQVWGLLACAIGFQVWGSGGLSEIDY